MSPARHCCPTCQCGESAEDVYLCCSTISPCSPCEQLKAVQYRIADAEAGLKQALEEERKIKEAINQSHDPFFHHLPTEISCRIFSSCLPEAFTSEDPFEDSHPDYDRAPAQFTLGAVCRRWRTIIWSEPRFWNTLIISLTSQSATSFCALVEEWLGRSGGVPLHIAMRREYDRRPPDRLITSVLETISTHIHRCSTLVLDIPGHLVSRLRCTAEEAPALRRLDLESGALSTSTVSFNIGRPPHPLTLLLAGFRPENVNIHWGDLVRFSAWDLTSVECREILHKSPLLVVCRLPSVREGLNLAPPSHSSPIKLDHLEELHLEGATWTIVGLLDVPQLKRLHFESLSGITDLFVNSIRRSSCLLVDLTITNIDQNAALEDNSLLEMIQLTPSLKSLSLYRTVGQAFFRRLVETATWEESTTDPLLPKLSIFAFSSVQRFPWHFIHQLAPSPSELPPRMKQRPLLGLDFDFSTDLDNSDDYSVKQADIEKILAMRTRLEITLIDRFGEDLLEFWANR